MIYLEDKKIEEALFSNKEEALVPIEITERDGELEIVTFEKTKKIAIEFEERFSSNPFSSEAIAFLDKRLNDIVLQWGYFVDDINEGHILTYINECINHSLILPNTKMIRSAEKYQNLTDYEFEPLSPDGDECYFVAIEDDKIVSVCEMNAEGVFIGATEINTYTSPDYRKRGYAASCVTAMCDYLSKKDKKIAYTTQRDNAASQRLAEKCGFKKIAQTYYYICYRND